MACRTTAVEDKYLDRRAIARECELIVHFLDFLRIPLSQWAGHGRGPGWEVARAFDRFVVPTRFVSISLDQRDARTPDDYSDDARMLAGQRALGFLDNALTQLAPIRDALAARRIGDAT
ncbi:hypothetical protein [Nocardia sp. NPDC060259]|uniref:hypothetical protein n=1 Tax=Nocardia sp. NPDC060259 TaxID=3347088 RepID=UPI0036612250